jgi:hypothetical protein
MQPSDVPLQDPPQGAAPEPVHAARVPCGCPLATRVHVPTLPPMSHASHAELHTVSQHTPSMQLPELHCPPYVQTWPLVNVPLHTCGVTPVSQIAPPMQSVSRLHVVPHTVPAHL